jgi:hypothetical protein
MLSSIAEEVSVQIRVVIREMDDGRWEASTAPADAGTEGGLQAAGPTRDRCLANFVRSVDRARPGSDSQPVTILVESLPRLAGVAEAAQVMGWDKRRVVTYVDRGRFPEPIQSLASGRVWLRSDVEGFAVAWRARQEQRARRRADKVARGAATDPAVVAAAEDHGPSGVDGR